MYFVFETINYFLNEDIGKNTYFISENIHSE